MFKDGAQVLAAAAVEFFRLGHVAGEVTVRCRMLRHEGGIALSRTETEAYVSSDEVFALLPYFSWQPGIIHIVAGADIMD